MSLIASVENCFHLTKTLVGPRTLAVTFTGVRSVDKKEACQLIQTSRYLSVLHLKGRKLQITKGTMRKKIMFQYCAQTITKIGSAIAVPLVGTAFLVAQGKQSPLGNSNTYSIKSSKEWHLWNSAVHLTIFQYTSYWA